MKSFSISKSQNVNFEIARRKLTNARYIKLVTQPEQKILMHMLITSPKHIVAKGLVGFRTLELK